MVTLSPREVQPRQSLLFSATIPKGIQETADLDKNCVFINTLKPGEENTHEHVPQEYAVVPMVDMFTATVALLKQAFDQDPTNTKVILFFPTARQTGIFYSFLQNLQKELSPNDSMKTTPVAEVHSRKSQSARVRSSEVFSKAQRGILCSSDVTARGVDFPGVTHVIQVGLPQNSDQYIHRLGRTARECSKLRKLYFAVTDSPFLFLKTQVRVHRGQEFSSWIKPRLSSFKVLQCVLSLFNE